MTRTAAKEPQIRSASSGQSLRYTLLMAACLAALALTVTFAVGTGSVHYHPSEVITALRHGPPDLSDNAPDQDPIVLTIWTLRLPRVLLAAIVGAALAAAGVAFQSLLRNDLADPYIVGVSSGASVGVEAVLLRHGEATLGGIAVPLAGFVTAMMAMGLVYTLARRNGRVHITSLLLGGVVVSAVLGAVSTLMLQFGHPDDAMHIMNRLMGSFGDATLVQSGIVGAFLVAGVLLLQIQARSMNVFTLGEEGAQQLGVEVDRFKTVLIMIGSLLTAATVAFSGVIGFVGLVVPHIARRLTRTPRHEQVLPIAVVLGAVLLVLADTAARSIMPDGRELPVGIITAFLGGPFFLMQLRRQSAR